MTQAINKRKSPRQERAQATVAFILEASAHILVERGHGALNTNQIAMRAGVSVGSLYQYFPNKEAIMTELIRQKRERMLTGVDMALADTEADLFEAALNAVLEVIIQLHLHWPNLALALDQAEAFLPLNDETIQFKDALKAKIEHLLCRSEFTVSEQTTQDVIAISKGMIEHAGLAGETDEVALRRRVIRAVMGYLSN
ncbi:TetR/AcrR family transcriptional regulator [Pacificibacter marinus]|uniref:TetR/AcrR family transcriptional regulator n=1 Tax=Pacificibacter marinus TaxID=658057 RepID=UPI001C071004|nr:TetR/AcrR family transcriptional regulator [Pacificibacter marinus]MBU2867775.1 TetR/AcrR family transcriptional regulator [Pacificibacter marinus]